MKVILDNTKPTFISFGKLLLKPGLNEVDKVDVEAIKKHPTFKVMIEKGLIEIKETESEESGEVMTVEILVKLSAKEANEVISRTIDQELLANWLKAEKRKAVKEKIEHQIKLLEGKVEANLAPEMTGHVANAEENLGHNLDEDKIK